MTEGDRGEGRAWLGVRLGYAWLILSVLAVGCGASFLARAAVQRQERLVLVSAFEKAAINRAAAVRLGFEHSLDTLEALGAFCSAAESRTRDRFRQFAGSLWEGHPSIRGLVWIPRVSNSERAAFERREQRELPGFQITEPAAAGRLVRAGDRAEYFPVLYLEPLAGSERALGLDLASDPLLAGPMRQARDSGRITATGRVSMVPGVADQPEISVFLPVYDRSPAGDSLEARRAGLVGFAAVSYRVSELVQDALAVPEPVGIDLVVSDVSAPPEDRLSYVHPSRLRQRDPAPGDLSPDSRKAELQHTVTFEFGGRTWSVWMTPAPGFFELPTRLGPVIALLVGLLLTALLAGYSWLLGRRAGALEDSNRALSREMQERRRVEENLHLFQSLMHHSAEAIYVIDPPSGGLLYVNEQAARQLGHSIAELLRLSLPDLVVVGPFENTPGGWQRWADSFEKTPTRVVEARCRRKGGESFPVELSVSRVVVGGRDFLVAIAEDISVRKDKEKAINVMQERLLRLSSLDGLTGVANRRLFDERLALEWRRAVRYGSSLSLIIADIDHFKLFNDHYGHLAGDECLQKIAKTFSLCVSRPADLVARFGGEELAVLLPETRAEGAQELAERIRTAVEDLAIPHEASPDGSVVTVSLGVGAIVPARDSLLRDFLNTVDAALYDAKHRGRNRTVRAA